MSTAIEAAAVEQEPLDVVVVGGGPAGLAAALAAVRAGARVALFEPRRGPIDKPCGEGLMAAGVDALAELVGPGVRGRLRPFDRLRWVVGGRHLELPLARPGGSIPRPQLMEELEAALARTDVERHACAARVERLARGFRVRFGERTLEARCVVAADGLGGHACGWLRTPRAGQARRGVRARFGNRTGLETVEVHLGGPLEVYLTPLPGGGLNVAVLGASSGAGAATGHGAQALLDLALGAHPAARARLGVSLTAPQSLALGRPGPRRTALGGAFLAGDAAGSVDPVIGCGTTLALRTGLAAGRAAAAMARGGNRAHLAARYRRHTRREIAPRRALAHALLALSHRPRLLRAVMALGRGLPWAFRPLLWIASEGTTLSFRFPRGRGREVDHLPIR